MRDLVKSEQDELDIELSNVNAQEYFVKEELLKHPRLDKRKTYHILRPKSGYLFPTTLAPTPSQNINVNLFNMRYFEDSHSSLNKSFIGKLFSFIINFILK